ncbi:hypothetical protein [Lacimicrobium alkaliphilum]|uniref:Transposase n=1 Tax=Lacimicrobium alkaliphilum TaxID=1526571 RepID=A0ABQ1RDM9_9ALTE|nr:hypothetical protein [Lacimicrobium alkaliphilum]GGD66750.1 hypothetical protein GCM10011357_22500 [Lacimicrobium alkaliphilum]
MQTPTLTKHNDETDRQHMARKQQEKWVYQRKPLKCPRCGAKQIAKYLYGMVDYPGIEQDLAEGKIAIGGCDITSAHEG